MHVSRIHYFKRILSADKDQHLNRLPDDTKWHFAGSKAGRDKTLENSCRFSYIPSYKQTT